MNLIKKILIVGLPLFFIIALYYFLDRAGFKAILYFLAGGATLLIFYLWVLLRSEGMEGLPLNAGEVLVGPPFIISLSATLLILLVFLLALLKFLL